LANVNSKNGAMLPELQSSRQATKEKILEYISEHITKYGKGVYPHYISESLGITRQYVHELLKELIKETRVLKRDGHYFVTDRDLADIIAFAKVMKMASGLLISPDLIEPGSTEIRKTPPTTQSFNETFYKEFKKIVSGISASSSLINPKFSKNTLNEKYLFEFANRIGAFITYILLETMRPYEYNEPVKDTSSKTRKRNILADNLTRRAIDVRWLFEVFHSMLHHTDQVSQTARSGFSEPWFFEAKKNEFDNLMKTFAKVYPGIYRGLEEYWRNMTFYSTNALDAVERYAPHVLKGCYHQWQKIKIYKLDGNFYYCLNKCHLVINEIEKKSLDEREGKRKKI
jgi:hypothetical protein